MRDTSRSQSRRGLYRRREIKLLSIENWDDFIGNDLFHNAVLKTQMALELMECERPQATPFLHKLLMVGLPNFVIYLAARLSPEQLRQPDPTGRLPLHVVAESATEHLVYRNNVWYFHEDLPVDFHPIVALINKATPLQLLCHLNPHAGCRADYSRPTEYSNETQPSTLFRGFTPLESYLYSIGRHNTLSIGASRTADGRMTEMLQDLQCLISIAPQALETRHPQTKLFPFMVPAKFYRLDLEVTVWPWEVPDECRLLVSMSYVLLRANPNVLNLFVHGCLYKE